MAQLRIVIIDTHHGQSLGAQVRAILQREPKYLVDLHAELFLDGMAGENHCPALLIPVLPVPQAQAEPWLATLQAQAPDAPMLPILQGVELTAPPDGLFHRIP